MTGIVINPGIGYGIASQKMILYYEMQNVEASLRAMVVRLDRAAKQSPCYRVHTLGPVRRRAHFIVRGLVHSRRPAALSAFAMTGRDVLLSIAGQPHRTSAVIFC